MLNAEVGPRPGLFRYRDRRIPSSEWPAAATFRCLARTGTVRKAGSLVSGEQARPGLRRVLRPPARWEGAGWRRQSRGVVGTEAVHAFVHERSIHIRPRRIEYGLNITSGVTWGARNLAQYPSQGPGTKGLP